jgi:hypothetical protein
MIPKDDFYNLKIICWDQSPSQNREKEMSLVAPAKAMRRLISLFLFCAVLQAQVKHDQVEHGPPADSPLALAQAKTKSAPEPSDEQFIRSLNGARYSWSRDFGGSHQSATYEIHGQQVRLTWQEAKSGNDSSSSIRREQFAIFGRRFFRSDHESCAIIFSGAQHCSCRYTIKADAIETTVLLNGHERAPSGDNFGICLGPERILRDKKP